MKSCSQRIFQNFVTEKSSAFDLPPLFLFSKCDKQNKNILITTKNSINCMRPLNEIIKDSLKIGKTMTRAVVFLGVIGYMGSSLNEAVQEFSYSRRYSWNKGTVLDEIEFEGNKYILRSHLHDKGGIRGPCLYLEIQSSDGIGGHQTVHKILNEDVSFTLGPSGSNPRISTQDGYIMSIQK